MADLTRQAANMYHSAGLARHPACHLLALCSGSAFHHNQVAGQAIKTLLFFVPHVFSFWLQGCQASLVVEQAVAEPACSLICTPYMSVTVMMQAKMVAAQPKKPW